MFLKKLAEKTDVNFPAYLFHFWLTEGVGLRGVFRDFDIDCLSLEQAINTRSAHGPTNGTTTDKLIEGTKCGASSHLFTRRNAIHFVAAHCCLVPIK